MEPGNALDFIANSFEVELCDGTTKLLKDCSAWQMLNLPVSVVLKIPDRLYSEYMTSSAYLESAMSKHIVQNCGKDYIMKKWNSIKSSVSVEVGQISTPSKGTQMNPQLLTSNPRPPVRYDEHPLQ